MVTHTIQIGEVDQTRAGTRRAVHRDGGRNHAARSIRLPDIHRRDAYPEKGDDFATALAKFNASRALCEQLQRLTQDAQQLAAYKRRMENLDAPIRFCRYQMQRRGQHTGGSEVDLESLAALTGPAADMLRAQVDAAMGNTNDTTALAPPPSEGNTDLLRAQLEAEMDAAATKATAALPRIGACTSTADAQPARHLVALYAAVADKAGELVTVADAAGDRTQICTRWNLPSPRVQRRHASSSYATPRRQRRQPPLPR
ncbi:signal recognition particle subunit SRP68 [Pseudoscourfieldia marina]